MIKPRRILIIATRQIGDVLITTPLIRRARNIWPDATIDVLGYNNTMGMLENDPNIHEIIESAEHPTWAEYKLLIKKITRKYDLAIVSQASDRAHIYGIFAAPCRIGVVPEKSSHNWWKKLSCTHATKLNYMTQHALFERFHLLDPYDLSKTSIPIVHVPRKELPLHIESKLQGKYVVIHATPMWRFKQWKIDGWKKLILGLLQFNVQIVLTGSNSQQDKIINSRIFDQLSSELVTVSQLQVLNLSGELTLSQMGTLLSGALGYVGVDTSITHLAAASGTRTTALFGATPPTNFGPWPTEFEDAQPWAKVGTGEPNHIRVQTSRNVLLIQGPGDCVPCRKSGCLNKFESHADCLDNLRGEDVLRLACEHFQLEKIAL